MRNTIYERLRQMTIMIDTQCAIVRRDIAGLLKIRLNGADRAKEAQLEEGNLEICCLNYSPSSGK